MIAKIVVTGPESSGKSTLAAKLAEKFRTVWVPEYARAYLDSLNGAYSLEDLSQIAKGQIALEEKYSQQANNLLICDTDLITLKIWSEYRFGSCDSWIKEQIEKRKYHFHLLCSPDIPWEPDPLRENSFDRDVLFKRHEDELAARKFPFAVINGEGDNRLKKATDEILKFFQLKEDLQHKRV